VINPDFVRNNPQVVKDSQTARGENPTLVDQFLEQDQNALELVQNARQYSDIDQTADSFVEYFLNNYAKDIPQSLLVDKGLLIKRIKGLYAAKGGSLSIEILFTKRASGLGTCPDFNLQVKFNGSSSTCHVSLKSTAPQERTCE
jgi:hypothetical protein